MALARRSRFDLPVPNMGSSTLATTGSCGRRSWNWKTSPT